MTDEPMIPTDDELLEWQRMCDAATAGPWLSPWAAENPNVEAVVSSDGVEVVGWQWYDGPHLAVTEQDAHFIATARTAMPRLIAAVRELREQQTAAAAEIAATERVQALERVAEAARAHVRRVKTYRHAEEADLCAAVYALAALDEPTDQLEGNEIDK